MSRHAELGMSAPPEVVFNTAVDPVRAGAWLPGGAHVDARPGPDALEARLTGPAAGLLTVRSAPAGGATVELRLDGDTGDTAEPADVLRALAREVDDNFNAG